MGGNTLRWVVAAELLVAVVFGALVLRPDAWVLWRPLVGVALAAFVVVPIVIGLYVEHADRKLRSSSRAVRGERV